MFVVVSCPARRIIAPISAKSSRERLPGPHLLVDDPAHHVVAGRLLLAVDEAQEVTGELARLLLGLRRRLRQAVPPAAHSMMNLWSS